MPTDLSFIAFIIAFLTALLSGDFVTLLALFGL